MSARQRPEPTAVSLMNNINLELQILLPTFIGRVRRRLYCVSFMATAFWVLCVVKSTAKIHSLHRKTTEKQAAEKFLDFFLITCWRRCSFFLPLLAHRCVSRGVIANCRS